MHQDIGLYIQIMIDHKNKSYYTQDVVIDKNEPGYTDQRMLQGMGEQ